MTSATLEKPPVEALELRESTGGTLDDEGNVVLHVIRPGIGRGRGNHLYTPEMLAENAQKFTGWKMYVDHLSPEARKAAGGLPRSWRDYGGRILESWWDPNVPADPDKGWEQGAVVAKAKPFGVVQEIITHDPEVMEASISATATGVRSAMRNGKRVWLVEGIEDRGSVDWVTEAGAGGRVVSLLESAYDEEQKREMSRLSELTDAEFMDYLREERPDLVEAIESKDGPEGGAPVDKVTLEEALRSEDAKDLIEQIVAERLSQTDLTPLVESAIEVERDLIRAEARADADRSIELRDMRDEAHKLIDESHLPDAWKAQVKSNFNLTENGPTPNLDVVDEIDDEGNVVKTAAAILRESVATEIGHQRDLLAAVKPTRVHGQGQSAEGKDEDRKRSEGTLYGQLLQEAGFDDPDKVWAAA